MDDDDLPEDVDAWFEHLGELILEEEPESFDDFTAAVAAMSDDQRRKIARSLIWHLETYNNREWS